MSQPSKEVAVRILPRVEDHLLVRYSRRRIDGEKVLIPDYHWFVDFQKALMFASMSTRDGEYCDIYPPRSLTPTVRVLG